MKFRMSKIAAAIAAATMASSAGAAVVLGGNDGWEVSMDGNINLFYNHYDFETTNTSAAGVSTTVADNGDNGTSSHLQEGLLPAFFSTNIKSPTVNGLTGTARISFAPDSSSAKNTFNDKANAIDMREVVANVAGSFGTVSFGRTLGLFGRQAILHDQTLFGVGDPLVVDGGGTTLGRIGIGYVYPEFRTRFAYATPNINGFKAEVGVFDPQEPTSLTDTNADGVGDLGGFETSIPKFEGELSYATSFTNGNLMVWGGGMWQEMDDTVTTDTVTHWGVEVGGEVGYMGFALTGYYYTGEALGIGLKNAGTGRGVTAGAADFLSEGVNCGLVATATCEEAENDGFYVQGAYNFGQGTKVALSYGESTQDGAVDAVGAAVFNDVTNDMWTVGVYHDLTAWLKLVAEYNNINKESNSPVAGDQTATELEADAFSVGAFMTW